MMILHDTVMGKDDQNSLNFEGIWSMTKNKQM